MTEYRHCHMVHKRKKILLVSQSSRHRDIISAFAGFPTFLISVLSASLGDLICPTGHALVHWSSFALSIKTLTAEKAQSLPPERALFLHNTYVERSKVLSGAWEGVPQWPLLQLLKI